MLQLGPACRAYRKAWSGLSLPEEETWLRPHPQGLLCLAAEAFSSGVFHACERGPIHFPVVSWECPKRSAGCSEPWQSGVSKRPKLWHVGSPGAAAPSTQMLDRGRPVGRGWAPIIQSAELPPEGPPRPPACSSCSSLSPGLCFPAPRPPAPPWPGLAWPGRGCHGEFQLLSPAAPTPGLLSHCLPSFPGARALPAFCHMTLSVGLWQSSRSPRGRPC